LQTHNSSCIIQWWSPSQAANQFYQPLFSNSPSAILFPSAILPSAIHFPPSAISFQPKSPHQKVSPIQKALRGEGHIVTRGTCLPASLNVNNLGKAAELHLAFSLSSAVGTVPNLSLQII
jgi:hypothetical protein